MKRDRLREIGVVAKTRGIKGGVLIRLDTPLTEEIENTGSLFLLIEGRAVPFIAESVSMFGSDGLIVVFRWYDTPAKMAGFQGCRVLIESDDDSIEIPPEHKMLSGFSIYDEGRNFRGQIISIEERKHQWLATVSRKDGFRFLVPIHEDLIRAIDMDKRTIVVSVPEGIEDLD